MAEFYTYRLMFRPPKKGQEHLALMPLQAGRLTQQYIADAYGKIESERLDWVRRNQDRFRLETLQGLRDHVCGLDYAGTSPAPRASSEATGLNVQNQIPQVNQHSPQGSSVDAFTSSSSSRIYINE